MHPGYMVGLSRLQLFQSPTIHLNAHKKPCSIALIISVNAEAYTGLYCVITLVSLVSLVSLKVQHFACCHILGVSLHYILSYILLCILLRDI